MHLFPSYSMSALLCTSGDVQCLQILPVTLNVTATPPAFLKEVIDQQATTPGKAKTYL